MAAARDHGYHAVPVRRVVTETAEASSFVLDVPTDGSFAYEAGQFCTFRVVVDGTTHHRCYSMSSTPGVDAELQVTVKRVPGGAVSGWLLDHVADGDALDVSLPSGRFTLAPDEEEDELLAFAGGSGITPLLSILKHALATTGRRVRLLYANRDRDSIIFAAALDRLVAEHPGRLVVEHHLDVDAGFVDAGAVARFLAAATPPARARAGAYLCGPTPFMDVVESGLLAAGFDADRIHVERFAPAEDLPPTTVEPDEPVPATVTIDLAGTTATTTHRPGTTILQTARSAGMTPPYSCEAGSCATCMAQLVEGTARMHVNDALTDDEVAEGWILTCQAVPTSAAVHVVYEGN